MATKRKKLWTAILGIAGAAVLAFVTGAWAYSNGIERRLSACEASQTATERSLGDIRVDVRQLRETQTKMWADLGRRIDGRQ